MANLLPSTADLEPPETGPRVVGVDSEDAEAVLAALSADTARDLLAALHEEPATPSELADRADTSLQNTQYHLEKLGAADLVAVCGTRYSSKGREMKVYAPADGPLVLLPEPDERRRETLRETLRSLLGAVAGLAVVAVAVQVLLGGSSGGGTTGPSIQSAEGGAAGGLPPGAVFLLGGLLVVALVAAVTLWRR
ncbi:MAG: ArsR/SmtB family transcription factor [Halobacteriaceae archaeon]